MISRPWCPFRNTPTHLERPPNLMNRNEPTKPRRVHCIQLHRECLHQNQTSLCIAWLLHNWDQRYESSSALYACKGLSLVIGKLVSREEIPSKQFGHSLWPLASIDSNQQLGIKPHSSALRTLNSVSLSRCCWKSVCRTKAHRGIAFNLQILHNANNTIQERCV